jgi:hypothetical protein
VLKDLKIYTKLLAGIVLNEAEIRQSSVFFFFLVVDIRRGGCGNSEITLTDYFQQLPIFTVTDIPGDIRLTL